MFDAARAALLSVQAPVPAEVARTHSGLIASFSLHLVKPGRIAGYRGDPVTLENAAWALEQANNFLIAVQMRQSKDLP